LFLDSKKLSLTNQKSAYFRRLVRWQLTKTVTSLKESPKDLEFENDEEEICIVSFWTFVSYLTVTDLARFLGLSGSCPRSIAVQ